jgi:hypothetical protein
MNKIHPQEVIKVKMKILTSASFNGIVTGILTIIVQIGALFEHLLCESHRERTALHQVN